MELSSIFYFIIVAIGFGFVVFWHELGHFLAAKWAGVRVEQFAIGFGHALVSYRKGLGFRFGSSGREYEQLLQTRGAGEPQVDALAISPTEYRLNWMPLGGYVKMYGQEDMVASTTSTDPDHYMNKSVGKRMVIISAGVVMNVILAAMLFTLLFFIGYQPPAPLIGTVVAGSAAQRAGLQVGDTIISINGTPQHSWQNVQVDTALLQPDRIAVFEVQPAGTEGEAGRRRVDVIPERGKNGGLITIGIAPSPRLQAGELAEGVDHEKLAWLYAPDVLAVGPRERIVAVAGVAVDLDDYHVLDRAVRQSRGKPVELTVQTRDGAREQRQLVARLLEVGPSGGDGDENKGLGLAGLLPQVEVMSVQESSPNLAKLLPGDVIEQIEVVGTADRISQPSFAQMRQVLGAAGSAGQRVDVLVRRGDEQVMLKALKLIVIERETGQYGLGFMPASDCGSTSLSAIVPGSPASEAGVPPQGRVVAVAGKEVSSWLEVLAALQDAVSAGAGEVQVSVAQGEAPPQTYTLKLDAVTGALVTATVPVPVLPLVLDPQNLVTTTLQTSNPLTAIGWGLRETKDQIVQLYITLKRLTVDRTVSPRNLTGPVGIFQFGTIAASRGTEWIIWFLALISANLAVVNFLPIPILDGGHMVFLASEKITGRPPSPKVQTAALYAGLLLIVGLVLFVTYNDIQRLLM